MCEVAWALIVVTVTGVLSGQPEKRTLFDNLPSREACETLKADLHLVELGQRVICLPQVR